MAQTKTAQKPIFYVVNGANIHINTFLFSYLANVGRHNNPLLGFRVPMATMKGSLNSWCPNVCQLAIHMGLYTLLSFQTGQWL
jgi:hypothetical protein